MRMDFTKLFFASVAIQYIGAEKLFTLARAFDSASPSDRKHSASILDQRKVIFS